MRKLFVDIEVAPNIVYTWGLFNQNVGLDQIVEPGYTLCWAALTEGSSKPEFMSILNGEKEMLIRIHEIIDDSDIIVHYNGRKFDVPILNKDFVRMGLAPPDSYQQIDLLQTVRSRFRFSSNKLDFVSQFLGLEAKYQHKGMKLWHNCMRRDLEAWKEMRAYNIQDVLMLPDLYKKLLPWIQDHPNMSLYIDDEDPNEPVQICTNCGSENIIKNGVERLMTQTYQRYRCKDCNTPLRGRNTILTLKKRRTVLTTSKL